MTTTLQTPEKKTKKKFSKVVLIMLLVIIGLLCLCSVFGYFYGKTPSYKATVTAEAETTLLVAPTSTPKLTSTPEPKSTPESTNTPDPTNTPEPTNTSEPTNTPEPTSTSRPTNIPEPSGQDEILVYADKVATLSTSVSESLSKISTMSTMMGEDISLVLNDDFKAMYFATLDSVYEDMFEIVSLTPPPSFEKSHGYLEDAFYEFTLVRSLLKSGINGLNAEDITAGIEHMTLFSEYVTLATESLGQ